MMLAQEIIRRKREGCELSVEELSWFISELTNDNLSEGQVAAFAMATFFQGMTIRERMSLTESMRDSGKTLNWDLPGPVIDKHSTGGVGDCVSLVLAPALASCGGFVPMISGRGLGHTGGTLDKLDSIPGYNTMPDVGLLTKTVRQVGCAVVGQTEDIAPADKRLYAVRDVTATVESIDLITASILSKKLAMNLDALILDIKCGNGAFMQSIEKAQILANSLVEVGTSLGCKTKAVITDMNQPLCSSVGNSLEIKRCVECLLGDVKESRLMEVVCTLGGNILAYTGLSDDANDGYNQIRRSFETGSAAEVFEQMVSSLGGPSNFLNSAFSILPKSPIVEDIYASEEGFVNSIDTRTIGISLLELGGGRRRSKDPIDYAVGFQNLLSVNDRVDSSIPLGRIHARNDTSLALAKSKIRIAYKIGEKLESHKSTILEHIG